MIRVNLLPIKEARQRSAGRVQLAIFGLLVVAELAGFVVLYWHKSQQVAEQKQRVAELQTEVDKLKERVEETRKYEKKAKKLRQKRETLKRIEEQSIGPGPMLRELQVMLSKPRNIEERYAQREKGWNVDWEPENLWMKEFSESDQSFTVVGRAIDADDVAEFLHRLETASHFHKVKLDYVRPSGKSERELVEFRITGELSYRAKKEKDGS